MFLAVDIGNSRIGAAFFHGDELVERWDMPTYPLREAEDYYNKFVSLFDERGRHIEKVRTVAVASVIPDAGQIIAGLKFPSLTAEPVVLSTNDVDGIKIEVEELGAIGIDRLVNAVAAFDQFQANLIIVDAGTAITIDAVSIDGRFLGGIIAPGPGAAMDGLYGSAPNLTKIELESLSSTTRQVSAVGKNTEEALASGALVGFSSLIEGSAAKVAAELGWDAPQYVLTGGYCSLLQDHLPKTFKVDADLTLHGIRVLYDGFPART